MTNKLYHIISPFLLIVLFGACKSNSQLNNDPIVATFENATFRQSDLIDQLPAEISKEDSAYYANQIINNWIKQRLLVKEAEKVLKTESQQVQEEIERYREELLIHHYKNNRIEGIINEVISFEDIENYYNSNIDKYVLTSPIVRINYIIFPKEVEISDYIKKLAISNDPDDIGEFEDYIFRFAMKYDNFNENYIYFSKIQSKIEVEIEDVDKFLKSKHWIEFESGNSIHLIAIKQYMLAGETAPLDFVTNQVKSHLINQYKLDFLREIKDSLYQDALKYNKFSVFK